MSHVPPRVFSGKRFRVLRAETGIKASDIHRATGIAQNTLSNWARGCNTPTLESLILVADFMGLPVDAFLVAREEVASDGSDA